MTQESTEPDITTCVWIRADDDMTAGAAWRVISSLDPQASSLRNVPVATWRGDRGWPGTTTTIHRRFDGDVRHAIAEQLGATQLEFIIELDPPSDDED